MKVCTRCKLAKPESEFFRDRRSPNGRMARCKKCKTAELMKWRRENAPDLESRRYWSNRDWERERHLIRKYGVTFARYRELLAEQGGGCAICGKPEAADRMLDVDHDHQTGKVRGLLCTSCNRVLGHSFDSPDRLKAAASYLERHTEQMATLWIS